MTEILVAFSIAGLLLSRKRYLGAANPFEIYFFMWSVILLGYWLSTESFIPVSNEFLLLLITVTVMSLVILLLVMKSARGQARQEIEKSPVRVRKLILGLAQVATILAAPFVYMEASNLSGGQDLFTVAGYVRLRGARANEGMGFGALSYILLLSYIVSSIKIFLYFQDRKDLISTLATVAISALYSYLSTGRTGVVLLILLSVVPLTIRGQIKTKGVFTSIVILVLMFSIVTFMTEKGVSTDSTLKENLDSFGDSLRSYAISPLLAFYTLIRDGVPIEWGKNTFRIFYALSYALDLNSVEPVALIKEYAYVPDTTNVYTVYETYFRDFYYIGIFIPPIFLFGHWWLYKKAYRAGGKWVFYYGASTFPLIMQFFQDQYFSLFSMWFQVGFWYFVLIKPPYKKNREFSGIPS